MPKKTAKIGDCKILKSYDQYHFDDDRPEIPVRSKDTEFHCLERGVRNYIYYPQELISVRTFESEYLVTTEVESHSEYDALKEANERFSNVVASLSLVAKNRTAKLGKKRIKRGDEIYDFEIIGIFIKKDKRFIRLKLPRPLISGRNFFPKEFPKGFLSQAKKYLQFNELVFRKGLIYFQRAIAMKYSGVFSDLEIVLNFVKCIELICWKVGEDDYFGLSKTKFKNLRTKEVFEYAGKKMKVRSETIKIAKKAWDARSNGDIAHQYLYFNPYSKRSSMEAFTLVNYVDLESCASEFLRKYYEYKINNSRPEIFLRG